MSFLAFQGSELKVGEALSTRDVGQSPFHVKDEPGPVQGGGGAQSEHV